LKKHGGCGVCQPGGPRPAGSWCQARELTDDEDRLLALVCAKLGYDVQEAPR